MTGGRKEEWRQFTQMRRNRVITVEQYNAIKTDLERREAKAQKIRATAQAKRDAKKKERKAEKAFQREQDKAAKVKEAKTAVVSFDLYKTTKVYAKVEQGKKKKKVYQFQRDYTSLAAEQTTHIMERFAGESMKKFKARAQKEIEAIIADKNASMRMGSADGEGETWTSFSAGNMKIRVGGGEWQGMTREAPYTLEGLDFTSIANDGNCVPESLATMYPKWSLEKIMKELGPGPHYPEQVLAWCQKKDITCLGCDAEFSILVQYVSRNSNHKCCYFVCHDNHFYMMKNAKGVSIMNSRVGSRKPQKEETEKIERAIVVSDELDLTMENTLQIVSSGNVIRKLLSEYIALTHSIPQHTLEAADRDSLSVKSFAFKGNLIKVVRFHSLLQEVNTAWEKSYKSIFELVAELLSTTEKSCMNPVVMKTWKPRQHFAHLYTPEEWEAVPGVEQTWDANKQYSSALANMPCGWLVIPMSSFPRPYSGGVKDAIYYIETKNTMPCKGNGFYTRLELEYLRKHSIQHTVVYEILGKVLPKEHFHPIVEKAMKFDGFKHILNTLCGTLGKTEKYHVKGRVGINEAEAVQRCMETGGLLFDLNEEITLCANITVETLHNNNLPMYMQIHGYAAVKLAEMIQHLQSKGAVIRGYNTDSITFKMPTLIPIDVSTAPLGGWKNEVSQPFPDCREPMCRTDQYVLEPVEWAEQKTEDEFASWDEMLEWVMNGENVCIQGGPGFGKSTLLKQIQEKADCIVMAPTNNAALNIGGHTMHHTYKIAATGEVRYNQNAVLGDKTHELLDEVSMVGAKYYVLFQNPKTVKIAAGDFDQLLPVGETDAEGLEKLAAYIFKRKLTLTKYKRGDSQLLEAITKVRLRQAVEFPTGERGQLHLCMTNKQRMMINAREMAKEKSYMTMPKNDNIYRAYAGMPVISKATPDNGRYVNNQRWWVKEISKNLDWITLRNDTEITIPIKSFIADFLPGYAITIHASQSLTLSEPYTVWITKYSAFSEDEWWRLVLVGVSRATSLEQVGVVMD